MKIFNQSVRDEARACKKLYKKFRSMDRSKQTVTITEESDTPGKESPRELTPTSSAVREFMTTDDAHKKLEMIGIFTEKHQ